MPIETLDNKIKHYSEWRSKLSDAVQMMSTFLKSNNITDLRTHHQFETILGTLADDRLSVAFVAEFSRGKSEMINTLFFGDYKQRVLPSGIGRTTMCPTELMYDPNYPNSIRLLSIESRRDDRPLFELKNDRNMWYEIPFNVDDIDSVKHSLKSITDNKLVSKSYAQHLNFDLKNHSNSDFGLPINEYDEVEIPSWRHAIINMPHPLLEQGLVILDTPGLNAVGTEPELTINQLATAHAVIFILSLDTGVTATDLELWNQHLNDQDNSRKLVVLNKIDTLWDGIRNQQEIEQEIQKQITETAKKLNISEDNIFPASAQKGLLGKLNNDDDLIARSHILDLELAIAKKLLPQKHDIVVKQVRSGLENIIDSAKIIIDNRLKDADEHIAELKQLSSKNTDVISHIMLKVQSEKTSLEHDMDGYLALRSVYSKETGKLLQFLSKERLNRLIARTKHSMSRCASSITLQKTITKYFLRLNHYIEQAITQTHEIAILSEEVIRDFEQDHGIENFRIRRLKLEKFMQEIARLEQKHSDLKNTKSLFFREQMSITNRFYDSVCVESKKIFSRAFQDANNWNNNLMVPMETYVREHHTQLRRRLESVKRIHKASDTVETRLQELHIMQTQLHEKHQQFNTLKNNLADLLLDPSIQKSSNDGQEDNEGAQILQWDQNINF